MQSEEPANKRTWHSNSLYFSKSCMSVERTDVTVEELKDKANGTTDIIGFEQIFSGSSLLSVLSMIDFSHLISLNINRCNIDSLELICHINMPAVKSIRLTRNNVTSIRALRKGYWVNLHFLNIKDNKINDYQWLTQLKLPQKGFQCLTLHTRREQQKLVNNDIAWLTKLQPIAIENINHFIKCKFVLQAEIIESSRCYRSSDIEQFTLEDKIGFKMKTITQKYGNKTFDTSNCYDLQ